MYKMNLHSQKQGGAALITALICLFMVSMMGVISMRTAGTSALVASNVKSAAHTVRMATSALNGFLINPSATWDLRTQLGTISIFPPAVVGAANVNLQAEYIGKYTCPSKAGMTMDANADETEKVGDCYFFKASSNYVGKSGSDSTVVAGFFARN